MKYLNDVTKDCVGKVFKSKSSGDFKILKYSDSMNFNGEIDWSSDVETDGDTVAIKI